MLFAVLWAVALAGKHRRRRRSTNADVPYIMPGIELSPEQRAALQHAREAFMQFRFKQVFAKMLPRLMQRTFGSGAGGRNRMRDFLMPHLMPVAVKGKDGKEQIALMPAVLQGKVPYTDGQLDSDMLPEISGSQWVPGGVSPFPMYRQRRDGSIATDTDLIDSLLDEID